MVQANLFYSGSKINVSAENRYIIEQDFIDEYHWLPQDIDRIPYKRIQAMMLIKKQKSEAAVATQAISKFKQEHSSKGKGQSKRFLKQIG